MLRSPWRKKFGSVEETVMNENTVLSVTDEEQTAYDRLRQLYYPNWVVNSGSTVCDWFDWRFECGGPDDAIGWLYELLRDVVGLTASETELLEFLEYSGDGSGGCRSIFETRDVTLGALSVWVIDHSELVAVKPFGVCGRSCEAGGVYLALERIASRLNPQTTCFGPSTKLLDVVPIDEAWKFWEAAGVTANRRMPEWRAFGGYFGCLSVLVFLYAIPLIVAWEVFEWLDSPWELPLGFVCYLTWIMVATYCQNWMAPAVAVFFDRKKPPEWFLPPGITTFGDLARHLANAA